MSDDTLKQAIAGRIDQLDGVDVTFIVIMSLILGLAAVPVVGSGILVAFRTAPYALVAVFAVAVAGAVGWRFATALDGDSESETEADPLTTLEDELAAGEISNAEFEERLEAMIDAEERAEEADLDTEELELD